MRHSLGLGIYHNGVVLCTGDAAVVSAARGLYRGTAKVRSGWPRGGNLSDTGGAPQGPVTPARSLSAHGGRPFVKRLT
jgi:hypothetical protein